MRVLLPLILFGFVNSKNLYGGETDWVNSIFNSAFFTTTEQAGIKFLDEQWNWGPAKSLSKPPGRGCTTEENKDGVCVKSSLCNKDQKKPDSTSFILREMVCPNKEICCPEDKIKTIPKVAITNSGCGWSNPGARTFREKSEANADYGEFPWMVALLKRTALNNDWGEIYLGGGSLIHSSVVMTVAHKFAHIQTSQIKCRAGEWDAKTADEIYPHQERNVRRIILHEDYDRMNLQYDVALLILESPFALTNAPHIGLACLGARLPDPRTQCYTMGWGENLHEKDQPIILKKIKYPLVDAQTCERNLKNSEMGPDYSLHKSFTCASGDDTDTCIGDEGSSLVCEVPNQDNNIRYAVVGMVMNGDECGDSDVPAVYVNVPQIYSWINRQMELNDLNKSYVY